MSFIHQPFVERTSSSQDWPDARAGGQEVGPEVFDLNTEAGGRHGDANFGGGPQRGPGPRIVPDGN